MRDSTSTLPSSSQCLVMLKVLSIRSKPVLMLTVQTIFCINHNTIPSMQI